MLQIQCLQNKNKQKPKLAGFLFYKMLFIDLILRFTTLKNCYESKALKVVLANKSLPSDIWNVLGETFVQGGAEWLLLPPPPANIVHALSRPFSVVCQYTYQQSRGYVLIPNSTTPCHFSIFFKSRVILCELPKDPTKVKGQYPWIKDPAILWYFWQTPENGLLSLRTIWLGGGGHLPVLIFNTK